MKKILLSIVLAVLMIFSSIAFIGCAEKPDDNNPGQQQGGTQQGGTQQGGSESGGSSGGSSGGEESSTPKSKVTLNGIYYSLSTDKTYYIVSGQMNVSLKNVVISATCENLPVKEIAQDAFRYSTMESITLPNSIVKINEHAFQLSHIKKIDLPQSVTHVGGGAFAECNYLEEVIIRGSGVFVDTFCFQLAYSLKRVVFLGEDIEIKPNAFDFCYRMVEFVIGDGELGDDYELEGYYIGKFSLNKFAPDSANPEAVITQNNFFEQDGLVFYKHNEKYYLIQYKGTEEELLVLPETIEGHTYSINQYAFAESVKYLSAVYIPSTVEKVGYQAFLNCGDTGFTIYCQTEKPAGAEEDWKPTGWSSSWNYGSYPVTWGYTLPSSGN